MDKNEESKGDKIVAKPPVRLERWYFGGLAGVLAACCTHPLDTLKVQLQTQQRADYGLVCKEKLLLKKRRYENDRVSSNGSESDS